MAALFRLQAFFNDADFPLGDKNVPVLLKVFETLYQEDVVEEGPMQDWRNDMRNSTPGHDKALLQLEGCVAAPAAPRGGALPPAPPRPAHMYYYVISSFVALIYYYMLSSNI